MNSNIICFKDLKFYEFKGRVRTLLYEYLSIDFNFDEIRKIAKKFNTEFLYLRDGCIVLKGDVDTDAFKEYLLFRLEKYLPFKNQINQRDAYFISSSSGIPLFGILGFGIVDRGTNIIEIRPLTSCPFDCIHCSLNEGKNNRRKRDFFVEYSYMVEYVANFIQPKENQIIAFINPQGETLMYPRLKELISDLKKIPKIRKVMIATRLPFWNEKFIDDLINAGLDQVQLSIDTLDPLKFKRWVGYDYNINRVLEFIKKFYDKIEIMLTPVWVPGKNDEDMFKLLEIAKKYNLGFGIQKYLKHKFGRKLREPSWKDFEKFLNVLFSKVGYRGDHMFETFVKDYKPKEIFKLNDIIEVKIVLPGRLMNEFIAVYQDRCLTVLNKNKRNIKIPSYQKVKIVRLNDNIAMGVIV